MYFIKLIQNTDRNVSEYPDRLVGDSYDTDESLYNLVHYIYRESKTLEDSVRPIFSMEEYTGCAPFIFEPELQHEADYVYMLMSLNNKIFAKGRTDIVKHRIISFDPGDYILPYDLNELGTALIQYYASNGFIAAYAVHRDTYHIHLHLIIDSFSYWNGLKLSIYNEYAILSNMVGTWYREHDEKVNRDYKLKEWYEEILFGDSSVKYGNIGFTVKEQIQINNKAKRRHK